jgi:uncharacterized protein
MSTPFDKTPYISVRSFKRDGSLVDTPVWCAPLDGKLVLFTLRESFKVKRIARNPRVQVAACTIKGQLLGPWHEGTCKAVDDSAHEARAYQALTRKYGLMMRIGNVFSTLSGRIKRRLVMEIELAPQAGAS